jgi:hypothetical protein
MSEDPFGRVVFWGMVLVDSIVYDMVVDSLKSSGSEGATSRLVETANPNIH